MSICQCQVANVNLSNSGAEPREPPEPSEPSEPGARAQEVQELILVRLGARAQQVQVLNLGKPRGKPRACVYGPGAHLVQGLNTW